METKISKTRIEKRMNQKTDSVLVSTIIKLKKTNPVVAKELAKPKRKWAAINLKDIDMVEGDVLVVGKVLSAGELRGSKKIVAWSASEKAIEKINDSKSSFVLITDEVEKNPELNGYNILK
jgi:ribosomal protein L18E